MELLFFIVILIIIAISVWFFFFKKKDGYATIPQERDYGGLNFRDSNGRKVSAKSAKEMSERAANKRYDESNPMMKNLPNINKTISDSNGLITPYENWIKCGQDNAVSTHCGGKKYMSLDIRATPPIRIDPKRRANMYWGRPAAADADIAANVNRRSIDG